jgi:hypothetical protein
LTTPMLYESIAGWVCHETLELTTIQKHKAYLLDPLPIA